MCWEVSVQYTKEPNSTSDDPCAKLNDSDFCRKIRTVAKAALFYRDSKVDNFDWQRANFDPFNNWPLMYFLESAKPLMT